MKTYLIVKRVLFALALSSVLTVSSSYARQAPAGGAEPGGSSASSATADAGAGDPAAGLTLFKSNCGGCHALDQKVVGPALKGVTSKHDKEWLHKWIKNAPAMIKAGDPVAVKLFNDNNQMMMTPFPNLSDASIDNILAYIESSDQPAAGTAAGTGGAADSGNGGGSDQSGGEGGTDILLMIGLFAVMLIVLLLVVILSRVIKTLSEMVAIKSYTPDNTDTEFTGEGRAIYRDKSSSEGF